MQPHPPKHVTRWTKPGQPTPPEFVHLITTGTRWGVSHEKVFATEREAREYAATITGGTWPSYGDDSQGPRS